MAGQPQTGTMASAVMRLTGDKARALKCNICSSIVRNAVRCYNGGGHLFCARCIVDLMFSKNAFVDDRPRTARAFPAGTDLRSQVERNLTRAYSSPDRHTRIHSTRQRTFESSLLSVLAAVDGSQKAARSRATSFHLTATFIYDRACANPASEDGCGICKQHTVDTIIAVARLIRMAIERCQPSVNRLWWVAEKLLNSVQFVKDFVSEGLAQEIAAGGGTKIREAFTDLRTATVAVQGPLVSAQTAVDDIVRAARTSLDTFRHAAGHGKTPPTGDQRAQFRILMDTVGRKKDAVEREMSALKQATSSLVHSVVKLVAVVTEHERDISELLDYPFAAAVDCPVCRRTSYFLPCHETDRTVADLRVGCPGVGASSPGGGSGNNGRCSWTGRFADYETHEHRLDVASDGTSTAKTTKRGRDEDGGDEEDANGAKNNENASTKKSRAE